MSGGLGGPRGRGGRGAPGPPRLRPERRREREGPPPGVPEGKVTAESLEALTEMGYPPLRCSKALFQVTLRSIRIFDSS